MMAIESNGTQKKATESNNEEFFMFFLMFRRFPWLSAAFSCCGCIKIWCAHLESNQDN